MPNSPSVDLENCHREMDSSQTNNGAVLNFLEMVRYRINPEIALSGKTKNFQANMKIYNFASGMIFFCAPH